MKIIFSPSKSQKGSMITTDISSKPLFAQETAFLVDTLLHHTADNLMSLYKLSQKKIQDLCDRYENFSHNVTSPSIHMFSGTSFKELDVTIYNKEQQKFLQNNLVILSALYGIVRPYDQVQNYRLDMNNNILKETKYRNLYHFWQPLIDDYFKDTEIIINLASGEYSQMLKNFQGKIINVNFKVQKNNTLRSVSVYSKQQRGKLLNYMIVNKCQDSSFLRKYSSDGFEFNQELSDEQNIVYVCSV